MVSYNLWNTQKWPQREPALRYFLTTFQPDILCLQEPRNETLQCISNNLPTHDHVNDELPGWICESNIFWNRLFFSELAHGLEKLDHLDPDRGLFWVRLKLLGIDKTVSYIPHPFRIKLSI